MDAKKRDPNIVFKGWEGTITGPNLIAVIANYDTVQPYRHAPAYLQPAALNQQDSNKEVKWLMHIHYSGLLTGHDRKLEPDMAACHESSLLTVMPY